jgi:hypothetical protein
MEMLKEEYHNPKQALNGKTPKGFVPFGDVK